MSLVTEPNIKIDCHFIREKLGCGDINGFFKSSEKLLREQGSIIFTEVKHLQLIWSSLTRSVIIVEIRCKSFYVFTELFY